MAPSDSSPPAIAAPIHRRVALIVHAPTSPTGRRRPLYQTFGWNDPHRLVEAFVRDLEHASYGIARYELVDHLQVDEFPAKADGFRYTYKQFEKSWRRGTGFHEPDGVDYTAILRQFELLRRVQAGELDEVWLMAFPYAGYYESIMAGPGAFWCNAPPLRGTSQSGRRFVIMGFNYERGVGEMLESYGHRAESLLHKAFEGLGDGENPWQRFQRHELSHPGKAQVGTIHFAPNSVRDYDWGNRRLVWSGCDDWYGFPDLGGAGRQVNCGEWGGGDIRKHHLWWLRHLPHVEGSVGGRLNNWWAYLLDPQRVPAGPGAQA